MLPPDIPEYEAVCSDRERQAKLVSTIVEAIKSVQVFLNDKNIHDTANQVEKVLSSKGYPGFAFDYDGEGYYFGDYQEGQVIERPGLGLYFDFNGNYEVYWFEKRGDEPTISEVNRVS